MKLPFNIRPKGDRLPGVTSLYEFCVLLYAGSHQCACWVAVKAFALREYNISFPRASSCLPSSSAQIFSISIDGRYIFPFHLIISRHTCQSRHSQDSRSSKGGCPKQNLAPPTFSANMSFSACTEYGTFDQCFRREQRRK